MGARRATVLVGMLVALSLLMLVVGAVALGASRASVQGVDRMAAVRAEYNAESALNVALREAVLNSDVDGNGTVGTFNPASVATLNSGTMAVAAVTAAGTTTVTATGGAQGSGASANTRRVALALAVRASQPTAPGLYAHLWEGVGWQNISATNWTAAPQKVTWVPNLEWANTGSGEVIYRGQASSVNARFMGKITVPSTGAWGFRAQHDDGVELLIGGARVLFYDSGTSCTSNSGSISLSAGTHDFEFRFNDGGGAMCLTLYWTAPGGSEAVVPPSAFSHAPSEVWPGIIADQNADFWGSGQAGHLVVRGFDNSAGGFSGTTLSGGAHMVLTSSQSPTAIISDRANFDGTVHVPPGASPSAQVQISNNATVTGGVSARTVAAALPLRALPAGMPSSSGDLNVSSGTYTISSDMTVAAMNIGNASVVNVSGHRRVRVTSHLTVTGSARIEVLANSSLQLFLDNSMYMWNTSRFNDNTRQPDNVRIFLLGTGKVVEMGDQAMLWAHIRAPRSAVKVWGNTSSSFSTFGGTIYSNDFETANYSPIYLTRPGGGSSSGTGSITSWTSVN